MTPEVCAAYTAAFLQLFEANAVRGIAIGMDLRPSSPAIARACLAAARARGVEPLFCGVLPTPALAHYAMRTGMPAIMVTGSHIPYDRNGL